MDQIQNGVNPKFLQHLLANPSAVNPTHRQQLEALVQIYPACSIFRLLLAKAVQNADAATAKQAVQSAAVYASNREVLFKLIHQPKMLTAAKPEKFYPFVLVAAEKETNNQDAVFSTLELPETQSDFAASYPVTFINPENVNAEATVYIELKPAVIKNEEAVFVKDLPSAENSNAVFIDQKSAETDNQKADTEIDPLETTDAAYVEPEPASIEDEEAVFVEDIPSAENNPAVFTDENLEEAMAAENDFRVEDVGQTFVNEADEEVIFPQQTILTSEENLRLKPDNQYIDEEIYDEITAIEDINFGEVKTVTITLVPPKPILFEAATPAEIALEAENEPETTPEEKPLTERDEAEKAMLSNIASTDYFTFSNRFGHNQTPDVKNVSDLVETASPNTTKTAYQSDHEADTVSKYHDDKMPYTFMLHQQYIESIFHTKAPLKVPENLLPQMEELPVKKKEKLLIERFIIEEPHIHPPSMEKLDTENKAKRSSEDADILVTETLAKVYLDQMLYHKALDTYKKLMLKFPEKSVYFAAQITETEKKIN
ncbi:MAG: hypothetical protein EOP42_28815 [Sphingobacteriaceae bacterium]|nr:MAG: hypothetical protein EOP42_28815 [Sphingobacteriaceae bacterium]